MTKIYVDYEAVDTLFRRADIERRGLLYEHEVYQLIRAIGGETLPKHFFLPAGERLQQDALSEIPGDRVVLKIISPLILHKSDVSGVQVVSREPEKVLSAIRRMMVEVPENLARAVRLTPERFPEIRDNRQGGDSLEKLIADEIRGVLICQYIPMESRGFGSELIVSLRHTREFGMIFSAGLGGTDTELYAQRFKKGEAVVAASTEMVDGETFFSLFQQTISYAKLSGMSRSGKRRVTDAQLLECFCAMIALGNHFSPRNPQARFVIDELEVNPFAFYDFLMMPLDGLCRFSLPQALPPPRPTEKIEALLHPKQIGIIGVSAGGKNFGRILLQNILANGFPKECIRILHPSARQIDGVRTVPEIERFGDKKCDLMILAVPAAGVEELIDRIIEDALSESVLLIPGGIGEKEGSQQKEQEIRRKIQVGHEKENRGPVFLGGNSLGILSHPGKYDSMFITETKLPKNRGDHPRNCALISQSGAYMITRMSKMTFMDPAYAISIGNQIDLTAGDILQFLNNLEDIEIIAAYIEGFQDLDGLKFAREIRRAVQNGKEVLFYKAGRTPEGRSASAGHTASIAGDYMVCESSIEQAGALAAKTFTGFEGLFRMARSLHRKKIAGNRIAAVSNAGYEAVGMADNILGEGFRLEMADYRPETMERLAAVLRTEALHDLVDVRNPMDLTPMAADDTYEAVVRILLEDPGVDAVVAAVVPLTPLVQTLPEGVDHDESLTSATSIAVRLPKLAAGSEKPLVLVVDSGTLYDPLADALHDGGLPVFRSADQAVWVLGKYMQGRLRAQGLRDKCKTQ